MVHANSTQQSKLLRNPKRLQLFLGNYVCFNLLFQAEAALKKTAYKKSATDVSLVFIRLFEMSKAIGRYETTQNKLHHRGEQKLTAEPYTIQKDKELIAQCLSSNQEAWSQIYRRLYRTVHFIIHWNKWGFSQDQAEEIMQDTFTSLITSLKAFNFECSLETYVANIAERNCIAELRRISALKRAAQRHSISMHATDDMGALKRVLTDSNPSLLEELQQSEAVELLKEVLNSIGDKCRIILNLKYYDNYSYEDMAWHLKIPRGTVASRLKRCLLELRDLYTKHSGEYL